MTTTLLLKMTRALAGAAALAGWCLACPAPGVAEDRTIDTFRRVTLTEEYYSEGIGVGDPDRLIGVIKRWEDIGITGINFLLNASETIPQEEVLASLRLFAAEVMPKFQGASC